MAGVSDGATAKPKAAAKPKTAIAKPEATSPDGEAPASGEAKIEADATLASPATVASVVAGMITGIGKREPGMLPHPTIVLLVDDIVQGLDMLKDLDPGALREIYRRTNIVAADLDQLKPEDWPAEDAGMLADALVHGLKMLGRVDVRVLGDVLTRALDDGAVILDRAPKSGGPTVPVIEVIGPASGRRRAGHSFGPTARRFRLGELSEDQIATLVADPLLAVVTKDVPEADAPPLPEADGEAIEADNDADG